MGILSKNVLFKLFCGAGQKNGNRIRIPWVRLPPDMGRIFSRKFFPNFKKFQQFKNWWKNWESILKNQDPKFF